MWQKVAKFKGAEYFRKALYLFLYHLQLLYLFLLHPLYLSPPAEFKDSDLWVSFRLIGLHCALLQVFSKSDSEVEFKCKIVGYVVMTTAL